VPASAPASHPAALQALSVEKRQRMAERVNMVTG
jgi:hypothetical protein